MITKPLDLTKLTYDEFMDLLKTPDGQFEIMQAMPEEIKKITESLKIYGVYIKGR